MKERVYELAPREKEIADLLLQGCENDEIGKELKIARRTVKAHFNRLFVKFGIKSGIKRVKLATLLYRRQLCSEGNVTENGVQATASTESLNSSPRDSRTGTLQTPSEPRSTLSKTTSEPSTTNSVSGTALNSPSGTKRGDTKACSTRDETGRWNRRVVNVEGEQGYSKDLH